jgi:hypothetical protein
MDMAMLKMVVTTVMVAAKMRIPNTQGWALPWQTTIAALRVTKGAGELHEINVVNERCIVTILGI